MNTFRILQRVISTARFDAKFGQMLCWTFSVVVMVGGLYRLTQLTLTEPQFFMGMLLIVALSMLGLVTGVLLPIAQYVAEKREG